MEILDRNQIRRIIPRWRSFASANSAEEFAHHLRPPAFSVEHDSNFLRVQSEWIDNNSIENAIELLSYGFVLNNPQSAIGAADYLLKHQDDVSGAVIQLAKSVSGIADDETGKNDNHLCDKQLVLPSSVYRQIHALKTRLTEWPRHPILWVDLSLLYTSLGEDVKAVRAMRIALNIAPENRFVIRSAARLAIHLRDPEYAIRILSYNSQCGNDPWLLAADISFNTILKKSSKYIKKANYIVKDQIYPYPHITELASALGTLELLNGSNKKAIKYFEKSLVAPNDNSLAQAEWAYSRLNRTRTRETRIPPGSYEANARHAVRLGEWNDALMNCIGWAWDEPFSSSPCATGSFLSTSVFEDFQLGLEFCEQGLRANPEDNDLINNKTVCLANLGYLDRAINTFRTMGDIDKKSPLAVSSVATAGLLEYRRGNLDEGRNLYKEAMTIAEKNNHKNHSIMAALYLANEEIRANGDHAEEYTKQAQSLAEKTDDNVNQELLCRLNKRRYPNNKFINIVNKLSPWK